MNRREAVLGFRPQKEVPYNALLPYVEQLDAESLDQLAQIKANLGKVVQLRDIKIGGSHWTGQLGKYIRLYGMKFSKEDHIAFINLILEMIFIPELDFSLVQKFSQLLITLLKKRELISRQELVIPWRPLYKLVQKATYSPYEHLGLVLLPSNIANVLKNLVRVSRVYFPVESTQEMLDEWRPLLCPYDVKMAEGVFFLELFLPTVLYNEEYDQGFRLWFEEMIGIWDACEMHPSWETNLVELFARLSVNCRGHIDWDPYIPKIFTRLLRSFNLPVGTGKISIARLNHDGNAYEPNMITLWLANMLGGGSSTQAHLNRLFKSLESFYHPSNYGRWNAKLLKLLNKLSVHVVRRVHKERFEKSWEPQVPEKGRLSDADITDFVNGMTTVVFLAMFSKSNMTESASAIQNLATLRPEIVIPPLLEKTYPSLETLTEPHRLISCLQCTVSVARAMLSNPRWYPDGRNHVIPLLNLCLPGIDPNDIKKSLMTFQLLSTVSSLVPIVDCSEAVQLRNDLTEEEKELCSATAQFEDVVLQFFDRVFTLIENSVHHHTRGSDSASTERLNPEEAMLEVCLLSTANSIMQQCSLPIYKEALSRLYRFATESYFEIKVAGRFTSDLVRAAGKVNPTIALKMFVPGLCRIIIDRSTGEDLTNEEHLDNEFMWNLKLLSEVVRCDGQCLLPYKTELIAVLRATLHLKCKDAQELAGNLLRHILRSLSLIYASEYRSSAEDWDRPITEVFPIREWGRSGDLYNLDIHWHVPNAEEKQLVEELLQLFLIPELNDISNHANGSAPMKRERLLQCLSIVQQCLSGAGSVLPHWDSQPVPIVEGAVDLTRFSHVANCDVKGVTIDGQNVRILVANHIRPLLDHMLSTSEDDTKSLLQIVKIIQSLVYYYGTAKDEFDTRWKSRHIVKRFMENKMLGKKQHIRALLIDRAQLQHELRSINQASKTFTDIHGQLFADLFRLAISRYMEVRKSAQHTLAHGFHVFAYSYRSLLPEILKLLSSDPSIEEHQFKGALYVVLGENKRSLVTKRNWDLIMQLWPALVQAQLRCEKPSMLKLFDDVIDKLHSDIETTELSLVVHDAAVSAAGRLWETGSGPVPSLGPASAADMSAAVTEETRRNEANLKAYNETVEILVSLAKTGNVPWKFHQVSFEMLLLLVRYDARLPTSAVRLFVDNMNNVSINVRKICTNALSAVLRLQKRQHAKIEIDPYKQEDGISRPENSNDLHPGDRPDNRWLLYRRDGVPSNEDEWNKKIFIEKTHWGYYSWPRPMFAYAPLSEQPVLGRKLQELSDDEKPVYEMFTNQEYVETLIKYISLEENKGKDRFNAKYFVLFKGLFRNFDDAILEPLKPHVERMVADSSPDTHESSHRCAAEIIAGLIRGSKHWSFSKVQAMWSWLIPVLRTAISNFSVVSITNWGTCFATASESRDPAKLSPLFDLMMANPLSGEGGSFSDASRLYLLQGSLAQQEWRVPELLHKLRNYLSGHLRHPYKNVRDRIGSTLVNMFMYDIKLPRGNTTTSPTRPPFIMDVIGQLEQLRSILLNDALSGGPTTNGTAANVDLLTDRLPTLDTNDDDVTITDVEEPIAEGAAETNGAESSNGEKDKERKSLINLCKTILKWLQGTCSRTLQGMTPETLQFIPVMCLLESETKDIELRKECLLTLGVAAQSLLRDDVIPSLLAVVNEVSQMTSWHARAAILAYLQVAVFCNLFTLQRADVVSEIQQLVFRLLCDDQLEVRELAGVTLGGFLHCGYLSIDDRMMRHFETLSATPIKKRSRSEPIKPELLIRRHAGVIGLSACILAFPYQVPDFMPNLLMHLSRHVDDPQPIQMTVKKTLGTFKRTHLDSWHDHKQKFTDDQLVVLTELLVSPNYYA